MNSEIDIPVLDFSKTIESFDSSPLLNNSEEDTSQELGQSEWVRNDEHSLITSPIAYPSSPRSNTPSKIRRASEGLNSSRKSISSSPGRRDSSSPGFTEFKYTKKSWRQPSACFASSTPRFKEKVSGTPSPSTYSPRAPVYQTTKALDSSFSSSTPRWYQESENQSVRAPTESQWQTPCPTAYSPEKCNLDLKKGDLSSTSFRSSSPRFYAEKAQNECTSPSPTTYRPEDVDLDARKGVLSRSSFVSNTRRLFVDEVPHKSEAPCPTLYSPDKFSSDYRRGEMSKVSFSSNSPRMFIDKLVHPTESPGPGLYYAELKNSSGSPSSVPFKSTTKRCYEVDPVVESPPPTRYSPKVNPLDFLSGDLGSSTMKSTTKRMFIDVPVLTTEGPPSTSYFPKPEGTFSKIEIAPKPKAVQSSTDRFVISGMYSATKTNYPGPGSYYIPEIPESIDEAVMRRFNLQQRLEEARKNDAVPPGEL